MLSKHCICYVMLTTATPFCIGSQDCRIIVGGEVAESPWRLTQDGVSIISDELALVQGIYAFSALSKTMLEISEVLEMNFLREVAKHNPEAHDNIREIEEAEICWRRRKEESLRLIGVFKSDRDGAEDEANEIAKAMQRVDLHRAHDLKRRQATLRWRKLPVGEDFAQRFRCLYEKYDESVQKLWGTPVLMDLGWILRIARKSEEDIIGRESVLPRLAGGPWRDAIELSGIDEFGKIVNNMTEKDVITYMNEYCDLALTDGPKHGMYEGLWRSLGLYAEATRFLTNRDSIAGMRCRCVARMRAESLAGMIPLMQSITVNDTLIMGGPLGVELSDEHVVILMLSARQMDLLRALADRAKGIMQSLRVVQESTNGIERLRSFDEAVNEVGRFVLTVDAFSKLARRLGENDDYIVVRRLSVQSERAELESILREVHFGPYRSDWIYLESNSQGVTLEEKNDYFLRVSRPRIMRVVADGGGLATAVGLVCEMESGGSWIRIGRDW